MTEIRPGKLSTRHRNIRRGDEQTVARDRLVDTRSLSPSPGTNPPVSARGFPPGDVGNRLGGVTGVIEAHGQPVEGDACTGLGGDPLVHLVDCQGGAHQSPDLRDDRQFPGQPFGNLPAPALLRLRPLPAR